MHAPQTIEATGRKTNRKEKGWKEEEKEKEKENEKKKKKEEKKKERKEEDKKYYFNASRHALWKQRPSSTRQQVNMALKCPVGDDGSLIWLTLASVSANKALVKQ